LQIRGKREKEDREEEEGKRRINLKLELVAAN
jgi:hypothetical protein